MYVDEFTNPPSPIDWADATAEVNGLGTDDLLLAVAVSQRQYALSVAADAPVTDAQLDAAERAIETELRDDNWGQAAIAGANSLAGGESPDPRNILGRKHPGAAHYGRRSRCGRWRFRVLSFTSPRPHGDAKRGVPLEAVPQKELDRRAGSALVDLDDALKTSEQDTAEQERALTIQIIELCEHADELLDAQAEAFDQLRQLEHYRVAVCRNPACCRNH